MSTMIDRILREMGTPDLLDRMMALSGADRNSLLLELFERQTSRLTPAEVLKAYERSRFAAPAAADPVKYHELENLFLSAAQREGMETLLLSPSAPLGSCSSFGCVSQNNVVSSLRGTETLPDPTNMLAIIMAERIRREGTEDALHFASTARVVRAQRLPRKDLLSHFGLFCMVSSGCAVSSYGCETALLIRQLSFYHRLVREHFHGDLSMTLRRRGGYPDSEGFFAIMKDDVCREFPDTEITFEENQADNHYYQGLNFKLYMERDGARMEIGDGGFVDWLSRMTGIRKRRCLISGVGLERLM